MALRYEKLEQHQQTMLAVEIAENKYKKDDIIFYEDQDKNILKLINSLYAYIKQKAYKYAKKLNGDNLSIQEELEQEAIIAIYKALEKYDIKKCPEFFPYVQQWINAYMRAYQAKKKSLCKMQTKNARNLLSKIGAISDKPIEEQIKILGISKVEYDSIHKALRPSKQLQRSVGEDTEEREEYISANEPNPEQALLYKELSDKILKIKDEFAKELTDPKQRDILDHLISGTDSSYLLTEKYGITRQRVQQIKDKIKDKFRKRLENNGIKKEAMFMVESGSK